MKLKNSDVFTRPVLKEISEDFSSTFSAEFNIVTNRNSLELQYNMSLNSSVFNQYCSSNDVIIGLHMYSQSILYRKFIEIDLDDLIGSIELDRNEVFSKVEISPILIANNDFMIEVEQELVDVDDNNYFVKKGMILGYAETVEIEVDYSKTDLNDLVVIKPTDSKEQSNIIEIKDKVIYYLSNEEYNSYEELYSSDNPYTQRLIKIVHNAIYTRILYYIIESRENDTLYEIMDFPVIEYITQLFEANFPGVDILEIDTEIVNKYAIELSEISFVNITVEGEEDE